MICKNVFIEFADPRIRAIDHYWDIFEACKNAQRNLIIRHDVHLIMPPQFKGYRLFVEIDIPDKLSENFRFGNHLRGISRYLLHNFDGFYKDYLVGKRLLYYFVV